MAAGARPSRPISSVILPDGMIEAIRDDAAEFLESEAWYTKMGVPYRRGYLLYGPPGTGAPPSAMHMGLHVAPHDRGHRRGRCGFSIIERSMIRKDGSDLPQRVPSFRPSWHRYQPLRHARAIVDVFPVDSDGYWMAAGACTSRPVFSVILPDSVIEAIRHDTARFLEREAWYTKMGVPHSRGLLCSPHATAMKQHSTLTLAHSFSSKHTPRMPQHTHTLWMTASVLGWPLFYSAVRAHPRGRLPAEVQAKRALSKLLLGAWA
jgi:hypothetical protein